jgi:hypothetical protein
VNIVVVNHSPKVDAHSFALMVAACDMQLRYHFCPAWGKQAATVRGATDDKHLQPGDCLIGIFDHADAAGALGYHDESPGGHVYGKVFVDVTLQQGGGLLTGDCSVSSVLSHEIPEAAADAYCNLWADMPNGEQAALEVCDPVEGDSYVIVVSGVQVNVSNFVYPSYFNALPAPGTRFDRMGKLKAPFTMTPGGYMIVRKAGRASQVYGAEYPTWKLPGKGHVAARSARRTLALP